MQASVGGRLRNVMVFSVSHKKKNSVLSRDFCCLRAIFVVSCNSSLTRFQNSVDWNMFSPLQMLEKEGVNLSQKRRVLHVNSCRGRLTDSCSRNSDEMVHKGQRPQAKSSLCYCSLCIQISLSVLRKHGVSSSLRKSPEDIRD